MPRIFNSDSVNSDTVTIGPNSQSLVVQSDGKVGINTSTPNTNLTIAHEDSYSFPHPGVNSLGAINLRTTTNNRQTAITLTSAGTNNAQAGIYFHQDNSNGTRMHFAATDSYATGPQMRMTINNDGNVGIGEVSPLKIAGYGRALNIVDPAGGTLILEDSDTTTNYKIKWFSAVDGVLNYGRANDDGSNPVTQLTMDHAGNLSLKVGKSYMRLAYSSSSDQYSSTLGWNWINLGNNGFNDIIAGKTAAGGTLRFIVNNTADVVAHNGTNGSVAMQLAINQTTGLPEATLPGTSTISFGQTQRQMINLWSTSYGIGVQSNTTYFRSGGRFSWYRGGAHSNDENSPGTGGTKLMTLTGTGLGIAREPFYALDVEGDIYSRGFYRGTLQRGSYGSLSIKGENGGWAGIDFTDRNVTLMMRSDYQGAYINNNTWLWYFLNGVLTVGTVPWGNLSGIPSNARGNRTVSTGGPSSGSDGDIHYQIT